MKYRYECTVYMTLSLVQMANNYPLILYKLVHLIWQALLFTFQSETHFILKTNNFKWSIVFILFY